ncbi:MAG: DNA-binding response regulator [Pelagibacterium sp. SCN 64-44]|nr:MAG: DNA-binding response regulator [Pelagibacterium sp. SCN 64-44]
MIRVVIVDDHPIFRQGLAMALEEAGDLTVCGQGASAEDAIALTRSLQPDVVLVDLSMPGGGLAALRAIHAEHPQIRLAVLTASENGEDVMAALREGALGYVVKGVDGQALIEATRDVAAGQGYIAPALAARILSKMLLDSGIGDAAGDPAADAEPLAHLTPRETQVLELVAAGLSNKEIALRGNMQEKTVKHHMTRILHKLQARNRTEAAMILTRSRTG